jgi:hypothetical protein
MALVGTFIQQPSDELDYDINYTDWLSDSDTVLSATATVTPAGLTVAAPLPVDTNRRLKLWVSGGTAGVTYKVEVTMTTALNRVKQDEVRFKIKEY